MVKKVFSAIALFYILGVLSLQAQLVYHDASQFSLIGKATKNTETLYERLPSVLEEVTRKPVWNLGKNTAGLAIRFASDAQTLGAKWTLSEGVVMNHMTPTGIKGLDLYCLEGKKWVFVNSARPKTEGKENETTIINNMSKQMREYMLYLPLYDGLTHLEIGVDSLSSIQMPNVDLPKTQKPIVAYGTSILQGGCASRAGMAHTNILERWLNREVINLGFSGNGQLDYEIAEMMAEVDASVFVLDFMPNVDVEQINEKMENFYSILRKQHPNTPIIFIENPIFPQATYDLHMRNVVAQKNEALNAIFKAISKNDRNVSLLSSGDIIGLDNEATVDGIHFTDLGFMRYADFLYPILKKMIE